MSNNDYGVSDINWEVYRVLGYNRQQVFVNPYSMFADGYEIRDRGNNQISIGLIIREIWNRCPDFEHDLNAAIKLWDGVTTWGHVGLHTDVIGDTYYRAMTCGSGRDDGYQCEIEHENPATAICLSFLAHVKAKESANER